MCLYFSLLRAQLIKYIHGLETNRKHNIAHYLCWVGLCQNMGPNSAVSIVFSIITNSNNAIVPVTNEGLSSHMVVYGKIRTYTHAKPNYCISEGNHMENELYSAVNESPNHV